MDSWCLSGIKLADFTFESGYPIVKKVIEGLPWFIATNETIAAKTFS